MHMLILFVLIYTNKLAALKEHNILKIYAMGAPGKSGRIKIWVLTRKICLANLISSLANSSL